MEKMRQCRWIAKGCIKFLFLSLLVCIWGQKSDAKESNGLNFQELNSKTTQIEVLQKTVKGLASGNELSEGKTYSGPYSFWCGNLDDDVEPEMIVGVIEMDEWDRPVERLLVFDLKGKGDLGIAVYHRSSDTDSLRIRKHSGRGAYGIQLCGISWNRRDFRRHCQIE